MTTNTVVEENVTVDETKGIWQLAANRYKNLSGQSKTDAGLAAMLALTKGIAVILLGVCGVLLLLLLGTLNALYVAPSWIVIPGTAGRIEPETGVAVVLLSVVVLYAICLPVVIKSTYTAADAKNGNK